MSCGAPLASEAATYTFFIVFIFWSLHYIAVEIEMPFGDDANDLPLSAINRRFNKVLTRLLDTRSQEALRLTKRPRSSIRMLKCDSTLDNFNSELVRDTSSVRRVTLTSWPAVLLSSIAGRGLASIPETQQTAEKPTRPMEYKEHELEMEDIVSYHSGGHSGQTTPAQRRFMSKERFASKEGLVPKERLASKERQFEERAHRIACSPPSVRGRCKAC